MTRSDVLAPVVAVFVDEVTGALADAAGGLDGARADRFREDVVNEAFNTLEDLRLEARDVDLAAVLGLGFPAFRGGPIAYAKSLGPSELSARVAQLRRRHGDRFAPAPALARLIARATAGA